MGGNEMPGNLLGRLERLSGTGFSEDRMIKVVVNGSGEPDSIIIDPSAMRGSPGSLGERIVAAMKAALEDLHGQAAREIQAVPTSAGHGFDQGAFDTTVRRLTSQSEDAMTQFAEVRRRIMDRLPD